MNNKIGITIKGGNVTRLGLLDRILNLTDKLTTKELRGEWDYSGYKERPFKNGEIESIAKVYKAVAETISTIDTNGQGINVTGCNFSGMSTGLRIEQSVEEKIEETTQEGIVEDNENPCKECDLDDCDDCDNE